MKRVQIPLIITLVITLTVSCRDHDQELLKLWYDKPAEKWEEALPIGNGRLGAMIYGGINEDHIQFNEETLWSGEPHDYSNKTASQYLGKIRELIWQGKQQEAEKLALEKFMGVPMRQQKYQPFGDLWLTFPEGVNVSDYKRELDLSVALCKTSYEADGIKYTREYFASYPGMLLQLI